MKYLKRFTESKSSLTRDQIVEIEGHCRRLGLEEGSPLFIKPTNNHGVFSF